MNKRGFIAAAAAISLTGFAVTGFVEAEGRKDMPKDGVINGELRKLSGKNILIRVGGKAFTVDLYDNPTANDLLPRLPLTLKASNYPGYDEKVIRLKEGLSMEGAPRGDDPGIPEVGYYQPGRWIALYYGPIGYWSGKVPLGKIHATIDELAAIPDNAPVMIERAEK